MPIEILMPALSPTMEEGKLAKWLVKEGDRVASGDIIAEIETDKAVMEMEAVDEGVIAKLMVDEGASGVKVNEVIAVVLEDGEDPASIKNLKTSPALAAPQIVVEEKPASTPASIPPLQPAAPAQAPTPTPADIAAAQASASEAPSEGAAMLSVRDALRDAMAEEMRRDTNVFIMGEEVAEYQGAYKVTQGLLEEFGPRRVIDTPITEQGFAGLGVGAAFAGLRPIVEFMTFNFAMQAIDQIVNSASKTLYMSGGQVSCPIVFRGPNGAAARVAAQHSQDYSSWYAHIPGLKVIAPYTASDAKGLLKSAIRDPNPVIFLENEILYGQSFDMPDVDEHLVPIGKARIARSGTDVSIVSFSIGMSYALAAAEQLAEQGIDAEVIDLRTLRPMDMASVIASVQKTGRCVSVEEGWPVCSIGSEISAALMEHAFDYLDAPVIRITGKDVPMPYAANLEKLALPSVAEVVAAVKAVCYV